MADKTEVGNVAPRSSKSDGFESVSEANPMRFVAFYRNEVMEGGSHVGASSVLRLKVSVEVPASRVCTDADSGRLGHNGKPLCNWSGWDAEDAKDGRPPKKCPGVRWDGSTCGRQLQLKNGPVRMLHAKKFQFTAISPQEARFLATKFPKETDKADDYIQVDGVRGRIFPGKGRTWRELLDNDLLPEQAKWSKKAFESGPEGMTEEMPPARPQRA